MFLGEMDGIDEQQTRENPIVMLMTNRADILDPAVIRPGRIDKHIKVERPTSASAIEVLKMRNCKHEKKTHALYFEWIHLFERCMEYHLQIFKCI